MTADLFHAALGVLAAGAYLCFRICNFAFVAKRFGGVDVLAPPTAATISIIFGLFVAFGTSDITQRKRELDLAVQKEVNLSRAIATFVESVSPSANPLHQALVEYLQGTP